MILLEEDLIVVGFLEKWVLDKWLVGFRNGEPLAKMGFELGFDFVGFAKRRSLGGQFELLRVFDDGGDAVIGSEGEGPVAGADLLVEKAEKIAELAVGAVGDVFDFEAVGAEIVADEVVGGEIDAEQVGEGVFAEVLAKDDGPSGFERDFVAERRARGKLSKFHRSQFVFSRQRVRKFARESLGWIFPYVLVGAGVAIFFL